MSASHDFAHGPHAESARTIKAVRLETALARFDKTADDVAAFAPSDRRWFERVASVNRASDETWAKVLELMRSAEQSPARRAQLAPIEGRGLDHVHDWSARVTVAGVLRPYCAGCRLVQPRREGGA